VHLHGAIPVILDGLDLDLSATHSEAAGSDFYAHASNSRRRVQSRWWSIAFDGSKSTLAVIGRCKMRLSGVSGQLWLMVRAVGFVEATAWPTMGILCSALCAKDIHELHVVGSWSSGFY